MIFICMTLLVVFAILQVSVLVVIGMRMWARRKQLKERQ